MILLRRRRWVAAPSLLEVSPGTAAAPRDLSRSGPGFCDLALPGRSVVLGCRRLEPSLCESGVSGGMSRIGGDPPVILPDCGSRRVRNGRAPASANDPVDDVSGEAAELPGQEADLAD